MTTVVLLIIVGAVLLLLETLLPGMVAGVVGFGCLVGGVALGYIRFGVETGNVVLLAVFVLLLAGTACYVRFFPQTRAADILTSHGTVGELGVEKPELLHQTGVALTILRPSGSATINGHRVDVVAENGLVEAGAAIKVVAVEGLRVVVRPVPGGPARGESRSV